MSVDIRGPPRFVQNAVSAAIREMVDIQLGKPSDFSGTFELVQSSNFIDMKWSEMRYDLDKYSDRSKI